MHAAFSEALGSGCSCGTGLWRTGLRAPTEALPRPASPGGGRGQPVGALGPMRGTDASRSTKCPRPMTAPGVRDSGTASPAGGPGPSPAQCPRTALQPPSPPCARTRVQADAQLLGGGAPVCPACSGAGPLGGGRPEAQEATCWWRPGAGSVARGLEGHSCGPGEGLTL